MVQKCVRPIKNGVKDFQKCFKSRNGLDEEVGVIRSTVGLFNQNLFRLIRPIIKDDAARSMFLRIIFDVLSENKSEGNLASTVRDPLGFGGNNQF